MSSPERLATVVLLSLALLAVPVTLWRHGALGSGLLGVHDYGRAEPAAPSRSDRLPGTGGGSEPPGAGDDSQPGGEHHGGGDGLQPGQGVSAPEPYRGVDAGSPDGGLVVHVAGAVRDPGVYTLPAGARVVDAIRAAGGERDEGAAWVLNLAARVLDGDRIYVPTRQEVAGSGAGTNWQQASPVASGGTGPLRPVDINHASVQELDTVPGIGPALAQRIVAFRKANGPFARVEDLTRVPGIGPKTLESMKDWLVAR